MAISHAQLLLLLFVSIFFSPAALGTAIEFSHCHNHRGVVNVTKVEIIPYPIKFQDNPIFKITGVTSQNLTGKVIDILYSYGTQIGDLWGNIHDICQLTKCPVEPGPFVLTIASSIRSPPKYLMDRLPEEYRVTVRVADPNYMYRRGIFGVDNKLVAMCVRFKFHLNALPKFTNNNEINTGGLVSRVLMITNRASVTRVEMFPFNVTVKDNPVFRITAATPKSISSNLTVAARMVLEGEQPPRYSIRNYKLCDTSYHCPITPGRFVLALPSPYSYMMEAGRYRVDVQILESTPPFKASMSVVFWFSVSAA